MQASAPADLTITMMRSLNSSKHIVENKTSRRDHTNYLCNHVYYCRCDRVLGDSRASIMSES